MTIAASTRYKLYEPTVATTNFLVPFPIADDDDVEVAVGGAVTSLFSITSTYVDGFANDAVVILNTPTTESVEVYGNRTPRRENNYLASSPELAANLQYDADLLTIVQQEQQRDVQNAQDAQLSASSAAASASLAAAYDGPNFDTVALLLADTGMTYANMTVGDIVYVKKGGFSYSVASSGASDNDIATAGGIKLYISGFFVVPEMFNDMSTDTLSTAALNAALQYSAANGIAGFSSGDINVNGTIAPGGRFFWNWTSTRLIYTGADPSTDLVELLENPSAAGASFVGSGKYVIFDTKGCAESESTGALTIRASTPGNMQQANVATIPANVVAISCSEGTSAEMNWGTLYLLGCGHGLWQGDMRGTAGSILPYTRWNVNYLQIQFCLVAIEGGFQGNCFDDGSWNNVHLNRNEDNGVIRTDFNAASLFIKGKNYTNDAETPTVTTTAGSTTIEFSAAHGRSVGDVIAIDDANNNLNATKAIPLVSYVSAITDTDTLVVETAPDNSASGKKYIVNPASFDVANGDLITQHMYVEQILDAPIRVSDNGRVTCRDFKVSDGNFGSRHNVGILVTGFNDPTVEIELNQRTGKNNDNLKHLVGFPTLQGSGENNTGTVEVRTKNTESDFVAFSILGTVRLETDFKGGFGVSSGIPGTMDEDLRVRYTNGWRAYQTVAPGAASPMLLDDGRSIYGFSANLRSNDTATGLSRTGNCLAPSGGTATKTAGATGLWWENIAIAPGDLLAVDVVFDSITGSGFDIILFDSAGAELAAGDRETPGISVLVASPGRAYITVPAGSGADRIGFQCFSAAAGVLSQFIVRKVTSL